MRLVTYETGGRQSLGVIFAGKIYDLRRSYASLLREKGHTLAEKIAAVRFPSSMVSFIEGGEKALSAAKETLGYLEKRQLPGYDPADIKLKAPLIPRTIICGGANFHDHLDETHRSKPTEVEFFLKSPHAVADPFQKVQYEERVTRKYDYEVELGIIIGKPARHVRREEALDFIFGYTIFNDISARDRQVRPWGKDNFQLRFGEGKSYDTGAPIGPWIVTKDELQDVSKLALRTTISGELRQNNNMSNIIWDVPALVSYYSSYMTLLPGLLIASGTPGGPALGSDLELGADPYERQDGVKRGGYMKPGDIMRLEIEKVGVLENLIDY
ncbi:MAG: fumarylacetoacetate hydrolase family protein [Dethiobacteria bacterium]|jgi:2-keto-4-pentenoate hydratase/2-oxohepta-3-ene-1,7-dioic acid hydratase in catechol pathway